MSAAGVTVPPSTCSGAMYAGVPDTVPSSERANDSPVVSPCVSRRARPKSVMTTRVSFSPPGGFTSITLWLLKSRCTTPARCAAVSPAAI